MKWANKHNAFIYLFAIFKIEVQLIYIVSDVQHGDSVIHAYGFFRFFSIVGYYKIFNIVLWAIQ